MTARARGAGVREQRESPPFHRLRHPPKTWPTGQAFRIPRRRERRSQLRVAIIGPSPGNWTEQCPLTPSLH
jgi:hypothetical protein